ncbi:MAG: SusC/RagA family TonB-linked outer membrane protein, partial [Flavobacteriaceae bacterium]|nr:SusC/RagA family TonB-linked outer membrane protein [Flavobacteriaceae bacterium]
MLDYKLGVVFIFLTLYLAHTQIIVEGNVSDNQGPLAGVNVLVEGTSTGVISDFDGNFQINVSALNQILIFSYVGYQPLRLEVTSNEFLQVSMQAETGYLDEVVVVGYGTQTKSNLVGSVVSVDVEEANQVPTTNISELLRGRAAGVQVNLGDPRPGGFSNIVIRGNVSVAGGNNPLIIVDGLPYDNLNDIPADDIASIEILKDASSTAIYGARASNGVVLVTTKTAGETAKPRFSYSNYLTTQRLTRNFNLYSGEQFADLRRQANRNRRTGNYLSDGIIFSPFEREAIENNLYVDWEDLVLDDAQLTNHTFSVTTGGPRTKWYSSINYFNQSGIIPNSKYNRLSLKLNLNQKLTEKINVDVIVNYQDAIQEKETGGLNFTTITPLAKPFDDEGKLLKYYLGPTDVSFVNPLW